MVPVMTPVTSDNLAAVGYDASQSQLYVAFNSGTLYRYFSVPATVYNGLTTAGSLGSYLNHFIRGRYRYQRLQ
jgi:KTSC domain